MYELEAAIDVGERELVGDERVDLDLPVHVPVDDLWHVAAAARAAESGAFPDASGDELERPRLDFLARAGDADDHRDAPALVAAFERLAHHLDIADAFEAVIGAALGEIDEISDEIARHVLRIDEMRHAEVFGERTARRVDVDADDHVGTGETRALHDIETDAAQAEDDDVGAGLHLRRVDDRADARGDAAADVADLVKGCVLADLREGDLRHHRVIGEGRRPHVVENLLAACREAAGAVGHHALPLRHADRLAEV